MNGRHPIEGKLSREIVPYIVSADRLGNIGLYRAHQFYAWSHDLLAALTGYGIVHPLLQRLASPGGDQQLAGQLKDSGPLAIPLGVCAAFLWAVLKVYVTREEGE